MADIYILAIDLPQHDNPVQNAFRYQAGDVIMVRENDDGPGKWAEKAGVYKVVRVPGAASKWAHLEVERDFDWDVTQPRKIKRFDISAVYALPSEKMADHAAMGKCIVLSSAEASTMLLVTKPESGGLVI